MVVKKNEKRNSDISSLGLKKKQKNKKHLNSHSAAALLGPTSVTRVLSYLLNALSNQPRKDLVWTNNAFGLGTRNHGSAINIQVCNHPLVEFDIIEKGFRFKKSITSSMFIHYIDLHFVRIYNPLQSMVGRLRDTNIQSEFCSIFRQTLLKLAKNPITESCIKMTRDS